MALAQAILAFLIEKPYSGYDLAKQFNNSVGFFWKASQQQIYRELSKLEAQGWITPEVIAQEGRPDKRLYSITELGKQQLIEWLAQPSDMSPTREELLVKVFAGYFAPPQVIVKELERHLQLHQQQLSVYQDFQQQYFANPEKLSPEAKFQYLTLLNGIGYETHWVTWCQQAIQLLSD